MNGECLSENPEKGPATGRKRKEKTVLQQERELGQHSRLSEDYDGFFFTLCYTWLQSLRELGSGGDRNRAIIRQVSSDICAWGNFVRNNFSTLRKRPNWQGILVSESLRQNILALIELGIEEGPTSAEVVARRICDNARHYQWMCDVEDGFEFPASREFFSEISIGASPPPRFRWNSKSSRERLSRWRQIMEMDASYTEREGFFSWFRRGGESQIRDGFYGRPVCPLEVEWSSNEMVEIVNTTNTGYHGLQGYVVYDSSSGRYRFSTAILGKKVLLLKKENLRPLALDPFWRSEVPLGPLSEVEVDENMDRLEIELLSERAQKKSMEELEKEHLRVESLRREEVMMRIERQEEAEAVELIKRLESDDGGALTLCLVRSIFLEESRREMGVRLSASSSAVGGLRRSELFRAKITETGVNLLSTRSKLSDMFECAARVLEKDEKIAQSVLILISERVSSSREEKEWCDQQLASVDCCSSLASMLLFTQGCLDPKSHTLASCPCVRSRICSSWLIDGERAFPLSPAGHAMREKEVREEEEKRGKRPVPREEENIGLMFVECCGEQTTLLARDSILGVSRCRSCKEIFLIGECQSRKISLADGSTLMEGLLVHGRIRVDLVEDLQLEGRKRREGTSKVGEVGISDILLEAKRGDPVLQGRRFNCHDGRCGKETAICLYSNETLWTTWDGNVGLYYCEKCIQVYKRSFLRSAGCEGPKSENWTHIEYGECLGILRGEIRV